MNASRPLNQVSVFNYVTVPNAPTYRAIMQIFYEAKQHYQIELRSGEILRLLVKSGHLTSIENEEDLNRHIETLVEWKNLVRSHDTASVSRIDDFYRRRYLFHLSAQGEAAHRAVLDVEATLQKSGSLQSSMLGKILESLLNLSKSKTDDPNRLFRLLHDLFSAFDTLTQEANRFMADLNRFTSAERFDEDRFVLHKHAVLAYVSRFVDQLRKVSSEISTSINSMPADVFSNIILQASHSADVPPALDESDPASAWISEQSQRWSGIRHWFVGSAHQTATVERLAAVAVDAVVGLARTLGRLNDRRSRPADRVADLLTLARWFMNTTSGEEAHKLWQSSFGLYSVRHFHVSEDDVDASSSTVSWWEADPIPVPVTLRKRGHFNNSGQAAAAPDYSRQKEWIAQKRKIERQKRENALRRFVGRGVMAFSEMQSLDSVEFGLLLEFLDQTLTGIAINQPENCVRSTDGRLQITLYPPNDRLVLVSVTTAGGVLRCRNYRLRIDEVDSEAFRTKRAGAK